MVSLAIASARPPWQWFPGVVGDNLTENSGLTGVGVGGMLTVGNVGPIRISVDAAPWTVGTASVSLPTPSGDVIDFATQGWVHGPASFAGSTALTGGEVSVVTPIQVTAGLEGQRLTSIVRLQVRFVPEPVRWVLIVTGVVGLALLGSSRRQQDPQHQRSQPRGTGQCGHSDG